RDQRVLDQRLTGFVGSSPPDPLEHLSPSPWFGLAPDVRDTRQPSFSRHMRIVRTACPFSHPRKAWPTHPFGGRLPAEDPQRRDRLRHTLADRKSTRLNSSH